MIRSLFFRVAVVAVVCTALVGCIPPAFAKLDDILVDDRAALPEEFGRVKITRAGATLDGAPGMAILKGDTVTTAADGVAVVTLTAGWEVIFEPGTIANIENPSIFVKWGKLIIKKLQEVKEALTVNNEFVSAGAEGTVFVFEVTRDKEVRISVVEGSVVVNSRAAGWAAVTYQAGDGGMIRAGVRPSAVRRLDTRSVRAIQQRVVQVDQIRRLRIPAGALTPVVAPAAAPPPAVVPGAVVVPDRPVRQPAAELGARTCTVPKLIERTEDAAKRELATANLQAGQVTRLRSGTLVTQQKPAAGSAVACGSAVDFVIGTSGD